MTNPADGTKKSPGDDETVQPAVVLRKDRLTRFLIRVLAVYTAIVLTIVVTVILLFSKDSRGRAIILMASGLVILWVIIGGNISLHYRDRVRAFFQGLHFRWQWKFFLFATFLALVEEAITTSMTNLAPEFGSSIGVAYITASNNYLLVIGFSSVVVFVPEFAGWVWLLKRYAFTPNEVFLMYGLLGETMEATLNPSALYSGFWFFVYGLMVYLPAYSIPRDRGARPTSWYSYVLAYLVPIIFAIPVVIADFTLAHFLGIHLWK